MNSLEKAITDQVNRSPDFDFQGFKMLAYQGGKQVVNLSFGKTYRYYDIASLTKIVFTTPWFMELFHCEKKILSQRVQKILPWYPHARVQVGQLLNHSAGNQWWQPFYKSISTDLSPEQAYQQMESFCRKAPLSQKKVSVYSDIDFYLLGAIMEKVEGRPLHKIWDRIHDQFYPKSHFHFNRDNKSTYERRLYAPTENCPWRKKILRGEVHDENCWALGGIAPHAGLFARIEDLAQYGLFLRSVRQGKHTSLSARDLHKFARRSLPSRRGDWGFGFMLPSGQNSSAGELFSKKSFGHTGFTGTSFWLDPQRDLFVCLLSNRVHPSRTNKGFQRLRPQLHDGLVHALEESQ